MSGHESPADVNKSVNEAESHGSPFSFAQFLAALVVLLVSSPFIRQMPYGNFIETLLLTGVMLSAVLAIGGRRRALTIAILLVFPALVSRWFAHFSMVTWAYDVFYVTTIIFIGFVMGRLLRVILLIPRVNLQILCAGVSAYLTMGIFWGMLYALLERVSPGSFAFTVMPQTVPLMSGYNGIYFSFSTLATIGYGDIVPMSSTARMFVVVEAVGGLFYMTMLIARLVAIYTASGKFRSDDSCRCSCHGNK